MLTRRTDNRPALCCFSQLCGDAQHPRLFCGFGMPATIIRQYDPETKAWRMGQLSPQFIDKQGSSCRQIKFHRS